MSESSVKILDFDRDLHGGVREIICEVSYKIGLKGWKLKEGPKVVSSTECEIEVYYPGLELLYFRRINVKSLKYLTLKNENKQYYCAEVVDLSDESGISRIIFYFWSFAKIIDSVEQYFYSCKRLREVGNKIAKKQRLK